MVYGNGLKVAAAVVDVHSGVGDTSFVAVFSTGGALSGATAAGCDENEQPLITNAAQATKTKQADIGQRYLLFIDIICFPS